MTQQEMVKGRDQNYLTPCMCEHELYNRKSWGMGRRIKREGKKKLGGDPMP